MAFPLNKAERQKAAQAVQLFCLQQTLTVLLVDTFTTHAWNELNDHHPNLQLPQNKSLFFPKKHTIFPNFNSSNRWTCKMLWHSQHTVFWQRQSRRISTRSQSMFCFYFNIACYFFILLIFSCIVAISLLLKL